MAEVDGLAVALLMDPFNWESTKPFDIVATVIRNAERREEGGFGIWIWDFTEA